VIRFKENVQKNGLFIVREQAEKTMFGTEHRITVEAQAPEMFYLLGKLMGLPSENQTKF
jgi:hypothetical protein